MIITAKFASTCPRCNASIAIGSKVEWSRGTKAIHAGCIGRTAVSVAQGTIVRVADYLAATPARPSRGRGRGRWNGCSCGARELPGGGLSANACAQCRFDEDDC